MNTIELKIVPGPHVYDQGIIYQDAGIQPHIAMMATYFDQETRDTMGRLYAAAPLLLSALLKMVQVIEEKVLGEYRYTHPGDTDIRVDEIPGYYFPSYYHEAKAA